MTAVQTGRLQRSAHRNLSRALTLGEALSSSDNALNFVRLLLAVSVVVGHTGMVAGAPWPWQITTLGGWAVFAFFIISGYLITGSRIRSRWLGYSVRRVARIFPAAWAALLFVALVLAPLAAVLGAGDWSLRSALGFVVYNAGLVRIDGAFPGVTLPTWNGWLGPMWTLKYELMAYAGCLIVFVPRICRRHPLVVGSVLFCASLWFYYWGADALGFTEKRVHEAAQLASFFCTGVVMYGLRERIPVSGLLLAASSALTAAMYLIPEIATFPHIPMAFAVLLAGAVLPVRIGAVNDISYGIYVLGFPVQQTMAVLGVQRAGFVVHLAVSLIVTVLLASLSWRFIERPAMHAASRLVPHRSPAGPGPAPSRRGAGSECPSDVRTAADER